MQSIGKPKETSDINMNAQITNVTPQIISTQTPLANNENNIQD
jgi:hypothetical protein